MGSLAAPVGTDVEYPEGPKVPEGDLHLTRRTELLVALRNWLAGRRDAWVSCDINIYYREGDPAFVVAPDLAVSFGVDREALAGRRVYRVWEAGAAPVFALEIASSRTFKQDLRDKPRLFADLGVGEYWRLDPTDGDYFTPALQGEHRRGGRWEQIPILDGVGGSLIGHSAALGLDLCWTPPKLRLYDPATDTWLLDAEDLHTAHRAETQARQAAETRAEAEAAARHAAEAELTTLRRQLHHRRPSA